MYNIFNLTRSNKFFFLYIIRHTLAILYKKKSVTIMSTWFRLKTLSKVVRIFYVRSKVDMTIGFSPYMDSVFNLGFFNFILTSICRVFLVCLALL